METAVATTTTTITTITPSTNIPTTTTTTTTAVTRAGRLGALATLARRRLTLSAGTPREVFIPLLTPVLFAVVIAPALAEIVTTNGIDYMSYVAVSTIGLLIPLSCLSAGIGVIVDRQSGARRDLLAAPVPRSLLVLGNLAVALLVSGLQLVALLTAAVVRGAEFDVSATRTTWFVVTAVLFAVGMYGAAETLANRIETQEEYIAALPAVAIVPWFFAGSLFPIATLPAGLTAFAKVLPLTHVLALMRYGLVDPHGTGLRDIWGMSNTTTMAALSLGVVVVFAAALTALAVRVFTRSAVQ
jgi:ABC-2 type transport system permease protein